MNARIMHIAAAFSCVALSVCGNLSAQNEGPSVSNKKNSSEDKPATATFGGGCFWCVEAVFEELEGVEDVVSGYAGGWLKNPTYEQVCTKRSGHAEVCEIKYDPEKISYKELLEVFWKTHDPTTPNQQGPDKGPQYRSVIFYHDAEQKKLAESYKRKLDESGAFPAKIVTEIAEAPVFYMAEKYHQDFFRLNPNHRYCAFVVRPKVEKFKKVFSKKLQEK